MLEVSIYEQQDKARLAEELKDRLANRNAPVYMCIGTEKVFSDSLGPRVGTLLNLAMYKPTFVCGLAEKSSTRAWAKRRSWARFSCAKAEFCRALQLTKICPL